MRRTLACLALPLLAATLWAGPPPKVETAPEATRAALEAVQRQVFDHFWANDPAHGLCVGGMTREGSGRRALAVGGSGFGVMAFIVGAERGWVTRAAAAARVAAAVRFLERAERHHGAWPHWLDHEGRAVRFGSQIHAGDLVETSFMLMGLMCAQRYFDGDTPDERAIREATDRFRHAVQWDRFVKDGDLYWLWESTDGRHILPLRAYNEALVTFVLGLGAPGPHALDPAIYRSGWCRGFRDGAFREGLPLGRQRDGGPLFLSHYSFLGIDPRAVQDRYADYFLNGLRHTLANRRYCLQDAPKSHGYDAFNWGLTACAGPKGKGYKARCPGVDDGVVAPTAALSSIVYSPYHALQALAGFRACPGLMDAFGPRDAYAPAGDWVAPGRIAIDQGPIVVMIENYRSGLLWRLFMGHPDVRRGLVRAGMRAPRHPTGFPYAVPDGSGAHDLVRHPDRGAYELDFSLEFLAEVGFVFRSEDGTVVHSLPPNVQPEGMHRLAFDAPAFRSDGLYTLEMTLDGTPVATARLRLR